MKKSRLGEFQELILMSVIALQEDAYGNEIQRQLESLLKERLSTGAIQTALKRMEEKGFLTSQWGEATKVRGGRRKRMYQATPYAREVLQEMRSVREQLWLMMPNLKTL
ncbi:MAG: helix-turn-helix transcriptional regulator [Bacteroidota bacterium]